jgi:hypothetical protein
LSSMLSHASNNGTEASTISPIMTCKHHFLKLLCSSEMQLRQLTMFSVFQPTFKHVLKELSAP